MSPATQQKLTVGFACDHVGLDLKTDLMSSLESWGHAVEDLGTHDRASVDYPDYAQAIARGVREGRFDLGVLVCGTGIGMAMAANRFRGVRAALCATAYTARMARAHNDANVLCLGARVVGAGQAQDVLRAFVGTPFEGGRHARRVDKMDDVDEAGDE